MSLYEAQQRHHVTHPHNSNCASKCGEDHKNKSCGGNPSQCDEILADIEDLYSGHICRCTGYRGLRLAAKKILLSPLDPHLVRELKSLPENVVDVEQQSYGHGSLESDMVAVVKLHVDGDQRPNIPMMPQPQPPEIGSLLPSSTPTSSIMTGTFAQPESSQELMPSCASETSLVTEIAGGTARRWFSVKTLQDVKSLVDYAVSSNVKYKLVYGNTSAGIYKAAEWTDIGMFVNMNDLQSSRAESQPSILDGLLFIPAACTINTLKRFLLKETTQKTCETETILTLIERVAGNQVRNAGTVGGSVAMAVRRLFFSDTFLALASCGATADVHIKASPTRAAGPGHVVAGWERVERASLLSLLDLTLENFILDGITVPLTVTESELAPFIRCYKVARRLQNSHSLVNLACRVTSDTQCEFLVGNIANHYLQLRGTAVGLQKVVKHLKNRPHLHKSECLQAIEDILSTCEGELLQNISPNEEFDEDEARITLALNLMHRFLLDFFTIKFGLDLVQDHQSIVCNTYKDKMRPQNDCSHGVQGFRVNTTAFPVSEPMIKTTAVQRAEGEMKYTRTLKLPEDCLHAGFMLSEFSTGALIWNEDRLVNLSSVLSELVLKELSVHIAPEDINLYRAVDIGVGNCLTEQPTWMTYSEFLLADKEVVYQGQAVAIVVTPLQVATEYISKLLTERQVRESVGPSADPLSVVSFRDTYKPIVTLDNLDVEVPVIDPSGETKWCPRRFETSTAPFPNTVGAVDWISNLPPSKDPKPPHALVPNKVIDFQKYQNDKYVIVSGSHEVGSQYHFPMETHCALAYAPTECEAETHVNDIYKATSHGAALDSLAKHPISRMVNVGSINKFAHHHHTNGEPCPVESFVSSPVLGAPGSTPLTPKQSMHIFASTQACMNVSTDVSKLLGGINDNKANELYQANTHVESLGGGFGGKDPQSRYVALAAAFVADRLKRPCRIVLDRNADMQLIGKRHPMKGTFTLAACKATGKNEAMQMHLVMDAGVNYDASLPIMDLAILCSYNGYNVGEYVCQGDVYFSNKASNTAFRTFGVVQSHQITEAAVEMVIRELVRANPALNAHVIRERNFFGWMPAATPDSELQVTPFGQPLRSCNLDGVWASLSRRMLQRKYTDSDGNIDNQRVVDEILHSKGGDAGFKYMQHKVAEFNSKHQYIKQGLSVLPLMYGIGYTFTPMNVMRATMDICPASGVVSFEVFGCEMGQGLYTKLLQIASLVLGVKPHLIRINNVVSVPGEKYPKTGASTGTDLNGRAIQAIMVESGAFMTLLAAHRELHAWFVSEVPDVKQRHCWYDNTGKDRWRDAVEFFASHKALRFSGEYDMIHLLTQIGSSIQKGAPFYFFSYGAA
eukprot:gene24712-31086_t